jgi:hypothetical protein
MLRYLLLLLLFPLFVNGQYSRRVFGQVTKNDFVQDSSDAVILYKSGKSFLTYNENTGLEINTDFHVIARILSPEATDLGVVTVNLVQPPHGAIEYLEKVEGRTYWLENGFVQMAHLDSKGIFKERYRKDSPLYINKITLPRVSGDCIIEYAYTLVTPINIRDRPEDFYFQDKYPTRFALYSFHIPPFLGYTVGTYGYTKDMDYHVNKQNANVGHSDLDGMGTLYSFHYHNLPAFVEEPYMGSKLNHIAKVAFDLSEVNSQLLGTRQFATNWEVMNKNLILSDYFGKIIFRKTNFLKEEVKRFKQIADPLERAKAAYDAWNGTFQVDDWQNSVYLTDNQKSILESKRGTPKQINALFTSLLRELELDANPVILSRRSNGIIPTNIPMVDRFDYLVTKLNIGDKSFFLDITDVYLPFGYLPYECLNHFGFEVKEKDGKLVDIVSPGKYWKVVNFTSRFTGKTWEGKVEKSFLGYSGVSERRKYAENRVGYEKDFLSDLGNTTIRDFKVENAEDIKMSYKVSYEFRREEDQEAEVIYLFPLLDEQTTKHPFTSEVRNYPYDLGHPYEYFVIHEMTIPDGYEVESLPKSQAFSLPDKIATFTYTSVQKGDKITITCRTILRNSFMPAEVHDVLRQLYSSIVEKSGEPIVLKKK